MILNQTDTGKACPDSVRSLMRAIPGDSKMVYVKVYAMALAKVLDRLEALEDFERRVLEVGESFRNGAG